MNEFVMMQFYNNIQTQHVLGLATFQSLKTENQDCILYSYWSFIGMEEKWIVNLPKIILQLNLQNMLRYTATEDFIHIAQFKKKKNTQSRTSDRDYCVCPLSLAVSFKQDICSKGHAYIIGLGPKSEAVSRRAVRPREP